MQQGYGGAEWTLGVAVYMSVWTNGMVAMVLKLA